MRLGFNKQGSALCSARLVRDAADRGHDHRGARGKHLIGLHRLGHRHGHLLHGVPARARQLDQAAPRHARQDSALHSGTNGFTCMQPRQEPRTLLPIAEGTALSTFHIHFVSTLPGCACWKASHRAIPESRAATVCTAQPQSVPFIRSHFHQALLQVQRGAGEASVPGGAACGWCAR